MCKKVDIIIVNWNSGNLTMQAAAPYLHYKSEKICCNVIVVDNGSVDNSDQLFENRITNVIYNKSNQGFGRACNQAFVGSNGDYILLLNPDTLSETLVLEELVEFLEKNPAYGVTGPREIDDKGGVLRTCGRFPTFKTALSEVLGLSKIFPNVFTPVPIMTDWDHSESRDVDHVIGSYMLIRKSVLDRIGFMDEKYFVYLEDFDLNKRVNDAGFKVFYNNRRSVFHEGGGTGQRMETRRLFYSMSSRRIYWRKYLGRFRSLVLTVLSIFVEPFLRIIDSLIKERKLGLKKIGKAYYLYIKKILQS